MNCDFIQDLCLQELDGELLNALQKRLLLDHLPHCHPCLSFKEEYQQLHQQLLQSFSPFQLKESDLSPNLSPFFPIKTQKNRTFEASLSWVTPSLTLFLLGFFLLFLFFSTPSHPAPLHVSLPACPQNTVTPLNSQDLQKIEVLLLPQDSLPAVELPSFSSTTEHPSYKTLPSLSEEEPQKFLHQPFPSTKTTDPSPSEKVNVENSTLLPSISSDITKRPFFRTQILWEKTVLRGLVLEICLPLIRVDRGKEDFLEVSTLLTVHQGERYLTQLRVIESQDHQALCEIFSSSPSSPLLQVGDSFFAEVQKPHKKFVKEVYVQGEITAFLQGKIALEIAPISDLERGDLLSVYRENQKIGVLCITEDPRYQLAEILYQNAPFQLGDQVILEHQPEEK